MDAMIDPTDDYLREFERKVAQKKKREDLMRQAGFADDPEKAEDYAKKQEVKRWNSANMTDREELLRKYDGPPPGAYWSQNEEDAYKLSKTKKAEAEDFARRVRKSDMDDRLRQYEEIKEYNRRVAGTR